VEGHDLVVKISWPGSDRVPENAFLDAAIKKVKSTAEHQWAPKHPPGVLFAQDLVFGSDSTQEKVAKLFGDAVFVDEEYKYERRTLRIIIQERLYPLKKLAGMKDIAQVLLDVACIHRWLFEVAGILHHDPSLNNIMYRIIKGKVHGVLTGYDLSSWTASLNSDYTGRGSSWTSHRRRGNIGWTCHLPRIDQYNSHHDERETRGPCYPLQSSTSNFGWYGYYIML